MSHPIAVLAALLAAPSLPPAAEPVAAPVAVTPAAPSFDRYSDFNTKFKEALQVGAWEEMKKLVRTYEMEAITHVENLANEMARNNNERVEAEFQALARAWKEAHDSDFIRRSYVYHSELAFDKPRRDERRKALDQYWATLAKHNENIANARSGPVFEMCGAEFEALSAAFTQLGDHYFAGQSAAGAAGCFDDGNRGKEADLRRACEGWGKSVASYEKVDLKNSFYFQCKQRWERLVADGFGAPAEADPSAPGAVAAQPTAAAAPITAATAFDAIAQIDEVFRPVYTADDIYALWPIVSLGIKGTQSKFQALGDLGPAVLRSESSKVGIDVDKDGAAEKTIGITGNFATVDFEIGAGDEKRKWAFVCKTGIQDDRVQGLQTNLQPDDVQMRLYVMNAASVVGQVNGTPVRVIDDNMDGVYGSAPQTYYYAGLSEGVAQPDYDTVVVGASKRARPWSRYLDIGGAWYEMKSLKSGTVLEATPVTLETGTVKLDFKGPTPNWLILKGTGALEGAYFDIIGEARKPAVVPAGTYELFLGELRTGKKAQTAKCLIMPGSQTPKWTVAKGAETVIKLGGPFSFEFRTLVGEENVTVLGKSVTVVGSAKERYERTWNCVPRPDVSVRKKGTKKGSKPDGMDIVLDLLERKEDGSFRFTEYDTWWPIDTSFEIKKGEDVEVQLVEKKHKLFGEIESGWK